LGSQRKREESSTNFLPLPREEGVRKFLGLTHDLLDTSEEGEGVEDVVKELSLEANSCFRCLNALQGEILVEDIPQKDEPEAELCINDMKVTYCDHGHFERCEEPLLFELG